MIHVAKIQYIKKEIHLSVCDLNQDIKTLDIPVEYEF